MYAYINIYLFIYMCALNEYQKSKITFKKHGRHDSWSNVQKECASLVVRHPPGRQQLTPTKSRYHWRICRHLSFQHFCRSLSAIPTECFPFNPVGSASMVLSEKGKTFQWAALFEYFCWLTPSPNQKKHRYSSCIAFDVSKVWKSCYGITSQKKGNTLMGSVAAWQKSMVKLLAMIVRTLLGHQCWFPSSFWRGPYCRSFPINYDLDWKKRTICKNC